MFISEQTVIEAEGSLIQRLRWRAGPSGKSGYSSHFSCNSCVLGDANGCRCQSKVVCVPRSNLDFWNVSSIFECLTESKLVFGIGFGSAGKCCNNCGRDQHSYEYEGDN